MTANSSINSVRPHNVSSEGSENCVYQTISRLIVRFKAQVNLAISDRSSGIPDVALKRNTKAGRVHMQYLTHIKVSDSKQDGISKLL